VVALINTANENNYDFKILKSVVEVNKKQIELFFNKISNHYNGNIKGKHFGLWGLAFKPNTDDVREAPALALIKKMIDGGAKIKAFDPEAKETTKAQIGKKIEYTETAYDAIKNCDALIIVTEWNEFRNPDLDKVKSLLKEPVIFDGRNLYDLDTMKEKGFTYYSVGRAVISKK